MFYLSCFVEDTPHRFCLSRYVVGPVFPTTGRFVRTCSFSVQHTILRWVLTMLKPHFSMIKRSIQEDSTLPNGAGIKTCKKPRKKGIDPSVGEPHFLTTIVSSSAVSQTLVPSLCAALSGWTKGVVVKSHTFKISSEFRRNGLWLRDDRMLPSSKKLLPTTHWTLWPQWSQSQNPIPKRLLLVSQMSMFVHALSWYATFYIFTGPTTHGAYRGLETFIGRLHLHIRRLFKIRAMAFGYQSWKSKM